MNIKKFLPQIDETIAVKASVPKEIWERVNAERQKLDLTWPELVTALMRAFLEETTSGAARGGSPGERGRRTRPQ